MKNQRSDPLYFLQVLADAKHKHFVEGMNGGPGFWEVSDHPIEVVATEVFRSAIHAYKPVPTVRFPS